jgi:hypothetical protein
MSTMNFVTSNPTFAQYIEMMSGVAPMRRGDDYVWAADDQRIQDAVRSLNKLQYN